MLEHWVLPGAIVTALIVLFLAPAVEVFLTTRRVERRFCPHIRYEVDVEYLDRGGLGIARPVDVPWPAPSWGNRSRWAFAPSPAWSARGPWAGHPSSNGRRRRVGEGVPASCPNAGMKKEAEP